jgi:hypothetical protein
MARRFALYCVRPSDTPDMLFKIIAFIAAALPIILFLRSVLFRRPTRFSAALKEFKKEVDFAITVFLVLVGITVAYALGKLLWVWWTSV